MFDWTRESGLAEHFLLSPTLCPIDGQCGEMYLVVDEASVIWAMCDECEGLWKPNGSLLADDCLQDQRRVDRARLARREDLERSGLGEAQVIRRTSAVRGP